jgi:hypothetical protein
MRNTVSAQRGLVAYFKQPSGASRLGVGWAVRIAGVVNCTAIQRSLERAVCGWYLRRRFWAAPQLHR